jgi:hypothetical protein
MGDDGFKVSMFGVGGIMAKDQCTCEINFAKHGKSALAEELANSGDGYAVDKSCRYAQNF